jgi:hypothetical protein
MVNLSTLQLVKPRAFAAIRALEGASILGVANPLTFSGDYVFICSD